MIEGFERNGYWWLVDEPENKFHGTLKYNHKDGAILTISLSENSIAKYNAFKPYIILGEIDHEKITLVNCRFIGAGGIDPESRECIIIPETIFSGTHFYNTEDIKFISMDITYSCLDEWIDINSFSHSYSENGETIEYKKPDDIKVNIDGDINIVFTPITSAIILARYQKEAYIKQKWITRIEKKQEAPLDKFLEIIKHLQAFLCLAIREPVHVLKLNAVPIMTQPDIDNPQEVGIFYRSIYISEPYKYFTGYMLFSYQDVITILYDMITNWFKNQELLKPICGLYFGILVNPYLYPENQFLSLVQAVEAFHRRVYKGEYLPKDEYKKMILPSLRSAVKNIQNEDDELKQSIIQRLGHGYEYLLRKRLNNLIDMCGKIVPQLLGNKDYFIDTTVDTRNYLTHFDKDESKHIAEGAELISLTKKLRVLLEVCFVIQTSLDSNKAKELFSKNREIPSDAFGAPPIGLKKHKK